jgi:hypothetical protein
VVVVAVASGERHAAEGLRSGQAGCSLLCTVHGSARGSRCAAADDRRPTHFALRTDTV